MSNEASTEFLEHTAEVRIRVRAASFAALAAEAGRALATIELGSAPALPAGPWRLIEMPAADRGALLVDWLNELIFLAETERWVPVAFQVTGDAETGLRARVRGVPLPEAPARVKAATFSGLEIRPVPGGLEAEVVLDV